MMEEFDGSFLIRAFLIERECVYLVLKILKGLLQYICLKAFYALFLQVKMCTYLLMRKIGKHREQLVKMISEAVFLFSLANMADSVQFFQPLAVAT